MRVSFCAWSEDTAGEEANGRYWRGEIAPLFHQNGGCAGAVAERLDGFAGRRWGARRMVDAPVFFAMALATKLGRCAVASSFPSSGLVIKPAEPCGSGVWHITKQCFVTAVWLRERLAAWRCPLPVVVDVSAGAGGGKPSLLATRCHRNVQPEMRLR